MTSDLMIEHADPAVAVHDEALVAPVQPAAPPRDLVRELARTLLDEIRSCDPAIIAERLPELAGAFARRHIPNERGIYLTRWCVREWEGGRVYLHHFRQSDATDALHNHPWPGFSVILSGGYREQRLEGGVLRSRVFVPGDENELGPDTFHRVDLLNAERGCWTLFGVGERVQSWGFRDRETGAFTPWREALRSRGIEPAGERDFV